MAFTTPVTWTVGHLVTAAELNQQLKDNLSAIWTGTTNGDIDYYTSSTTKSRLAIGTVGQILKVAGGVPTWSGNATGCEI